ncbi:MAG TPA: hydantoinase B/oxoprolinase family protein [Chloroflexota bacterium]|jgi:N-methylhydantoinase B
MTSTRTLSPITLEVVRNGLLACADEMAMGVLRTAYNMIIYEIHDYACALVDAQGRLIAQNLAGVPIFLADMGYIVQDGLATFGPDGFAPGDVVLVNHPAVCGQHLNNVNVYTPVFFDGELVAFPAARAHWIDVGGLSTGFGASNSRDVYQEGLQIRAVKIYEGGRPNEAVLNLIRDNVRFADAAMGDLRAQIAACRLGERRLTELLERYGLTTVRACIERIYAESEALARREIAKIPDGVYAAEAFLDHDGARLDRPVPIRVQVVVAGDDMTISYAGTAPVVEGPLNAGPTGGAITAARVAYKCIVAPEAPANEGCFRPLRVEIPEECFLGASPPAPMGGYSQAFPTIIDTILHAVAPALPDVIPAAHKGVNGPGLTCIGKDPRTGEPYACVNSVGGGWGGGRHGDGDSAGPSIAQGDIQNAPIELQEATYPLRIEKCELRTDSGGAGEYRGGLGVETVYRALADITVKTRLSRSLCPPWGLAGGEAGEIATIQLQQPGGAPESIQIANAYALRKDGEGVVNTAGGGGWGDPFARDPARVAADVRDGYVSLDAARERYGVAIDPTTFAVDAAATAALRVRRPAPP